MRNFLRESGEVAPPLPRQYVTHRYESAGVAASEMLKEHSSELPKQLTALDALAVRRKAANGTNA